MIHYALLAALVAQGGQVPSFDYIPTILGTLAFLTTLIGALFGTFIQRRQRNRAQTYPQLVEQTLREADKALEDSELRDVKPRGESVLRATVEARLGEAQAALDNERTIERASRWSSHALIGGQFVVGGLLASSFVQQTLSATLVGSLGLIVLLSQIIRERFNPEGIGDRAKPKISRLNKLIRKTQNDLALYDAYEKGYSAGNGDKPSLHEMLKAISEEFGEIEDS